MMSNDAVPLLPARAASGVDMVGAWAVNTVYCVDALTMLAGLPDNSIDLVVTSPPYDNLRTYNGYTFDFQPIARETYRVMKPGGVVVWVVDDSMVNGSKSLTGFKQALYFVDECGFRMHQRIIWQKEKLPAKRPQAYLDDFEDVFVMSKDLPNTFNPTLKRNKTAGQTYRKGHSGKDGFKFSSGYRTTANEGLLTNVWLFNVGSASGDDEYSYNHPAPFPEKLVERHILTWSNAGDVVLDYFGGSGTTAKMARNLDRRFISCDISQEYVDISNRRLALPYTKLMFSDKELAG